MRILLPVLVCACAFGASAARAEFALGADTVTNLSQQLNVLSAQLPESAVALDPELSRALQLIKKRRHLDALAILRDKIRRDPDNLEARFIAVNAFIGIRRYEAAQTLLEQMLDKHPENPGLLNNLAWLYATADLPSVRNPERAIEFARRALMLSPNSYNIWSTLAEAYFANREFTRSLRAGQEALRLSHEYNASPVQQVAYEQQVAKCREAVLAFSIIE